LICMGRSVSAPIDSGNGSRGYNLPFGALTCASSAKR
jgi:hypothetical protein